MTLAARHVAPAVVLVALAAAAFVLDAHRYLTLDTLRDHRQTLEAFVAENRVLAALAYAAIYTVVVALSVPGAAVMTVAGGFLFGAVVGGLLAVAAATLGATLVFLAAKTAVGEPLRRRAGPALRRLEEGFRDNAFSYLLFLRLVPAFPFWVVNLAPSLLGVRLAVFVAATAIGIIPGTFIFAAIGAGLGEVFEAGRDIQLGAMLSPTLILALCGLGLIALSPVAIRWWRGR